MMHLMGRLKRFTSTFIEPRLQALGYTDFKLSYLVFLSSIDEQGITNSELAKQAGVTKQMTSKIVSLLEEAGYIYTQKKSVDCRSSLIFLSDRGKALFVQLKGCMQEVRSRFDALVGHGRIEQMIETITQLVDELDKVE
ncbi:MarR family winged helix-turn-helix transcriptional regulator [Spirosoma validum]|nr:MarR family transcriptional regulator [Spirosoma validum]